MADEAQRRALELFERLTCDGEPREHITAGESPDVIEALERLEAAAPRARRAFPTCDDRGHTRSLIPLPNEVGAYRFTHLLGEGGMGIVFAAERSDGLFEHEVAIKLIHPDRFGEIDRARFARERRLLARLKHPGIARLIDGGVTPEGWPYIIMEKVDGLPIDAYIASRQPDLRERARLLSAVCAAVQAAHREWIVHGDIKPDNVLVQADGAPRLLDFGVARLTEDDAIGGLEPRTAAYAAPERREGAPPSVAADIFALGKLACDLFGVRAPGTTGVGPVRDPDLAAVAAKAMAAEPDARYQSVETLAADLDRWRARRPVEARPLTVRYASARFASRHPVGLGAAVAGASLVLAMLALAIAGWHEARRRVDDLREIARFQLVEVDRRLDGLPRTIELRAQLAAEAQAFLDRLSRDPANPPELKIDAAEGLRRLALLQGAADRPSLSNTKAARRNLAAAAKLLDGLGSPQAQDLRARILISHARIAMPDLDTAGAAALLRQVPPAPLARNRLLRAEYLLARSELDQWAGRFSRATDEARRGRALLTPSAASPAEATLLARAFDLEAEAYYYSDQAAKTEPLYRQELHTIEQAVRRWPENHEFRSALHRARWAVGAADLDSGRAARAVPLLKLAYDGGSADATADPGDVVAARRQRSYMLSYAQALAKVGDVDHGVALIRSNIAARDAWWRRDPGDASRARDWMVAVQALGDVLGAAGRKREACRSYADAAQTAVRLMQRGRFTQLDRTAGLDPLRRGWRIYCRG